MCFERNVQSISNKQSEKSLMRVRVRMNELQQISFDVEQTGRVMSEQPLVIIQ